MRKTIFGVILLFSSAAIFALPPVLTTAQSGLGAMLNRVLDTPTARTVIWYSAPGDLKRLLQVSVTSAADIESLPPAQRIQYLLEYGQQVYYSPYSGVQDPVTWAQSFGLNPFTIEYEVTIGAEAADQYAIIQMGTTFDANGMGGALSGLGYQPVNIAGQNVFAFGGDGDTSSGFAAQLTGGRYNRVLLNGREVFAASTTAALNAALNGRGAISSDPSYAALATALMGSSAAPDAVLLSAVLYGGNWLSDEALPQALAASGLSADRLGITNSLPAYGAAGIGYSWTSSGRLLTVAAVYDDGNAASAAASALVERLNVYRSLNEPLRTVFAGWGFSANVIQANGKAVAVVTALVPEQTDVAWVTLAQMQDIVFLLP